MKPWKTALTVGTACVVCCAVPLVGGAAALTSGSAALAATGTALLACVKESLPLALELSALGVVVAGYILRRKLKREVKATPNACGCEPGACSQ